MQVEAEVKYMHAKFGGCGLSGFAHFKFSKISILNHELCIVHGGKK